MCRFDSSIGRYNRKIGVASISEHRTAGRTLPTFAYYPTQLLFTVFPKEYELYREMAWPEPWTMGGLSYVVTEAIQPFAIKKVLSSEMDRAKSGLIW